MLQVKSFTFNPFEENTYVVFDSATKHCVVVDPGCNQRGEMLQLTDFIEKNNLLPQRLLNTHCHIDHVLGNRFVSDRYALCLEAHAEEQVVLDFAPMAAQMYHVPYQPLAKIGRFMEAGEAVSVGAGGGLAVLFTPGHSPGSLSFYCAEAGFVLAGDALFRESIGRSDLPGGNHALLLESIRTQLFALPPATVVYSGHGAPTTIGHELAHNPFF